jgi:multiubiquitin
MLNSHAGNEAQEHRTKRFRIIVNARSKEVTGDDQSFEQIVALAFSPVPVGPNIVFTVTFRKGPRENPEGTLTPGESVEIKDGMIFDVTATDKS